MAIGKFEKISISNLSTAPLTYASKTLKFSFDFYRGIYSAYYGSGIKITISFYSDSDGTKKVQSNDIDIPVGDNYKVGDKHILGNFSVTLNKLYSIRLIKITAKNWKENTSSEDYSFIPCSTNVYESLTMEGDNVTGDTYRASGDGFELGLFPETDVSINEGEIYSILGSNQSGSYTSAYYYNDLAPCFKISIPTFKNAFNEIVEPTSFYFKTNYGVSEGPYNLVSGQKEHIFSPSRSWDGEIFDARFQFKIGEEQREGQCWCYGGGLQPISAFRESIDFSQINAQTNNCFLSDENTVKHYSNVKGVLQLERENIYSPYDFSGSTYTVEDSSTEANLTVVSSDKTKINLEELIPYGQFNYILGSGWESQNYSFFSKEVKIILKPKNRFTETEEEIAFSITPLSNNTPILSPKAILEEIYYGTSKLGSSVIDNKMIINPKEKLRINIRPSYIYFPESRGIKNWASIYSNLKLYIQNKDFTFPNVFSNNWHATAQFTSSRSYIEYSYEGIISNFNIEKEEWEDEEKTWTSVKYTQALNFKLSLNDLEVQSQQIIQMGRVALLEVTGKTTIGNGVLTYSLSEYGGDKNPLNPISYFTQNDFSLSRSAKEKLVLSLCKEDGTSVKDIVLKIPEENFTSEKLPSALAQLRSFFVENNSRQIGYTNLTQEALKGVTHIIGTYYYSYSGENTVQTIVFKIDQITILDLLPPLAICKGGVKINGAPKTGLTPVDSEDTSSGEYFIEINALNIKDRIIINYPGGINGEIYCDENNICFSPNFAITNGDEKITFSDLVTFIRSIFPQ